MSFHNSFHSRFLDDAGKIQVVYFTVLEIDEDEKEPRFPTGTVLKTEVQMHGDTRSVTYFIVNLVGKWAIAAIGVDKHLTIIGAPNNYLKWIQEVVSFEYEDDAKLNRPIEGADDGFINGKL